MNIDLNQNIKIQKFHTHNAYCMYEIHIGLYTKNYTQIL